MQDSRRERASESERERACAHNGVVPAILFGTSEFIKTFFSPCAPRLPRFCTGAPTWRGAMPTCRALLSAPAISTPAQPCQRRHGWRRIWPSLLILSRVRRHTILPCIGRRAGARRGCISGRWAAACSGAGPHDVAHAKRRIDTRWRGPPTLKPKA